MANEKQIKTNGGHSCNCFVCFKVQIETYRTAYNQHRNGGDEDIDADIVSHAIISPIYDTLGYAFVDFAEDDVPELVIGAIEGDSYYAWDIFAYDGTSVFRVSETGNYKGEELMLLEGNYIKECVYGHTVSNIKVYRLEKDTSNKVTVFYVNSTEQTKEIQRNENEELRPAEADECEQLEAEINSIPAMSGIEWIYF